MGLDGLPLACAALNLALVILLVVRHRKQLLAPLHRGIPGIRAALIAVTIVALLLRATVPYKHVEAFDSELMFVELGRGVILERVDAYCILGSLGDCEVLRRYYLPVYPLVVSLSHGLLGVDEELPVWLSVAAGTLTVPAVFLLVSMLIGQEAGLIAALALAFLPMHIVYSTTIHTDVVSVLFETLAALALVFAWRARTRSSSLFAGAAIALFIQVRPDNIILLPFLAVLMLLAKNGHLRTFALVIPFLLAVPSWSQPSGYTRYTWSQEGEDQAGVFNLSPAFLMSRTPYLRMLFSGVYIPTGTALLVLLGIAALARQDRRLALLVLAWLILRLGIFIVHGYPLFQPRSMLAFSLALCIFAGVGGGALASQGALPMVSAVLLIALGSLPTVALASQLQPAEVLVGRLWATVGLPVIIALSTAGRTGPWRRVLVGSALALLVCGGVLYTTDAAAVTSVSPDRYTFERDFFIFARTVVGEDCTVASFVPFHAGRRMDRPVVSVEDPELLEGLVGSGACVVYVEMSKSRVPWVTERFRLGPKHTLDMPRDAVSQMRYSMYVARIEGVAP